MDKLTTKSQEAIQEAQRFAERKGNQQIDAEHLLWAILNDEDGIACQVLRRLGVDARSLQRDVEEAVDRFPKVIGATPLGQIYISPRLKEVFENAQKHAEHLKDEFTSVEHLLVSLIEIGGTCSDLLKQYGATVDKVLSSMSEIRGAQRVTDPNPEDKYQALQRFSRDLTELARKGKLDPVIGRNDEIRRIIQDTVSDGTAILLSSHNMLEVEFLCDRIALIEKGIIVEEGKPIDLMKKYKANNIEEVFTKVVK